jgi:hypothetical protein
MMHQMAQLSGMHSPFIQPSTIRSRDDKALVRRSTCSGISHVQPSAKANNQYPASVFQKALRSFVSPLLFVLHLLSTCMLHHGNDRPRRSCLAYFAFSMRLTLTPFNMYACVCRSCLYPALWASVEIVSRPMASRSCCMSDRLHCFWLLRDMATRTSSTYGITAATLGQCTSYRGLSANCPWQVVI